ncbi:hepatocyte growth factor-regulated tyrosine kinase substrate-like [Pollicipes pollicipes]|uniref:hepatocyte growth factor-regulated tyrosine kinase substrate-like n=1 Tax=Pollicipes pollicipes TaxID=41117 RepID=UPI001884BF07|nr:hepatocyte growth factor-regulated tyrosine kinase substrate-like [Pollicipes pollicipes]
MLRSSSATFDKLLEKATSHLLLEPDWSANLAICDTIRQGDVQAKYAVLAVKKKLYHENPHVAVYALCVLEAMMKNCGAPVHDEVGQFPFMLEMRELAVKAPDIVKEKLLELLQTWAHVFRQSTKYRAVQDTVNGMRQEGFKFPALRVSEAMFSAETAPEWADGEVCNRCRDAFTTFTRKHHCRACGQVFCGKCSSKTSNIPKFGIERDVRVCDPCFDQINRPSAGQPPKGKPSSSSSGADSDLPPEYLASPLSKQSQAPPPRKTDEELKEEEELNLALAISQSEADAAKEVSRAPAPGVAAPFQRGEAPSERDPQADPELARYLNRSYWESRQEAPQSPTAPAPAASVSAPAVSAPVTTAPATFQNGAADQQLDQFVATICSQLEIFVNRMKSNSSRGRPIANDSSVQTLFMNVTAMHSQLLQNIQLQDDQRVHYEGLQDQLAQARDARAALDALREEHRDRLRREAEEAQRHRQMQMMQKLEIMRKKKQEYLQGTARRRGMAPHGYPQGSDQGPSHGPMGPEQGGPSQGQMGPMQGQMGGPQGGHPGQMGPQGHPSQMGPQGHPGQAGPQGHPGQMGPQGHPSQMGPQDEQGQMGPGPTPDAPALISFD